MNVFLYGSPSLSRRAVRALHDEVERQAALGNVVVNLHDFTEIYNEILAAAKYHNAIYSEVRMMSKTKQEQRWKALIDECDDTVFIAHNAKCPTLLETRQYARRVGRVIRVLYGNEVKA